MKEVLQDAESYAKRAIDSVRGDEKARKAVERKKKRPMVRKKGPMTRRGATAASSSSHGSCDGEGGDGGEGDEGGEGDGEEDRMVQDSEEDGEREPPRKEMNMSTKTFGREEVSGGQKAVMAMDGGKKVARKRKSGKEVCGGSTWSVDVEAVKALMEPIIPPLREERKWLVSAMEKEKEVHRVALERERKAMEDERKAHGEEMAMQRRESMALMREESVGFRASVQALISEHSRQLENMVQSFKDGLQSKEDKSHELLMQVLGVRNAQGGEKKKSL